MTRVAIAPAAGSVAAVAHILVVETLDRSRHEIDLGSPTQAVTPPVDRPTPIGAARRERG